MPVVAYNEDAAEDVAGVGPEACPLGRLEQGGPERISERRQDPCWRGALGCADRPQVASGEAAEGVGDAGVLEVVVDFDGNTFRTVYTVRFSKAVYVLHAFQKKSRRAIATPKSELDLIGARLARAQEDYEAWRKSR
jgi:hypothetical protein